MAAKSGVAKLKRAYREWDRSKGTSSEAWLDLFADDIRMGSLAAGAAGMEFTRDHVGKMQVGAYFAELARDWAMQFYHVRVLIAAGNRVAAVGECCWRHRKTGKLVLSPKLDLWRLKSGKAVEFFEFYDTHQALGACTGEGDDDPAPAPHPLYPAAGTRIVEGLSATTRANVTELKRHYRRWKETHGGNVSEILPLLGDDVTWGSLAGGAPGLEYTQQRISPVAVAGYFEGIGTHWELKSYEADEFIAAGSFAVMVGSIGFRHRATGKTFASPKADFWRFRGRKIVEFFEYYNTAAALDAAR